MWLYGFLSHPLAGDAMGKYMVKYRRSDKELEFETIVEVMAPTVNQAMMKIKENRGMYKDLAYSDVVILGVEKV